MNQLIYGIIAAFTGSLVTIIIGVLGYFGKRYFDIKDRDRKRHYDVEDKNNEIRYNLYYQNKIAFIKEFSKTYDEAYKEFLNLSGINIKNFVEKVDAVNKRQSILKMVNAEAPFFCHKEEKEQLDKLLLKFKAIHDSLFNLLKNVRVRIDDENQPFFQKFSKELTELSAEAVREYVQLMKLFKANFGVNT